MLLSTENALNELEVRSELNPMDITEYINEANDILNDQPLTEAQYNKVTEHLRLDILDVEEFVKVNNCQQVDDPRAFQGPGIPSSRGLLSNDIFGTTMEERAGIYAYIDLHGWFMDPSCYKSWIRIDKNVKNCVHGIGYYSLDKNGYLVEDPKGETGIDFLHKNIDKIKFKTSESVRRDISVKYLDSNRDRIFIKKYIVIPPFYRDMNTSNDRSVGLSGINKLYNNLIISTNALESTQDYMFDASNSMKGRVQEIILAIYDWFAGNKNDSIDENGVGAGLSGKLGIIRRTGMSKTSNFSSRLVITAPELKAERPNNMKVDFDHSAIPLYSIMAEFRDFVIFNVRKFFENEFRGRETYPVMDLNGNIKYMIPDDPEITFSDDRIKSEMDRFIHGYTNRFIEVEIPMKETKQKYCMQFSGRNFSASDYKMDEDGTIKNTKIAETPINRPLTWCDIFYMAAVEATRNKQVLITRFPIDSYSNQITTKIVVASTKDTEPVYINDEYYPYYPKIRREDIGRDTSNLFADTINMSNLYLSGMGGDYDGDQVTCKGVYTEEANEELREFMNSKGNFITFGCMPLRTSGGDVINSMYSLTKIISNGPVTKTINFA